MLDGKEHIVKCLVKYQMSELIGQGIGKHKPTKELMIELVRIQEVQDTTEFRQGKL